MTKFKDANTEDVLIVKIKDGTSLPTWLSYDQSTRTFSGTPIVDLTSTIEITVQDNWNAVAHDSFVIKAGNGTAN